MPDIAIVDDVIHIGERFLVTLQRTLRVPDDGATYPLPPGFGPVPVRRIDEYTSRVPDHWRERGGVFVPLYQREALWLQFEAAWWKPNAVKVSVGGINAVAGETWRQGLHSAPQDYIVCPEQPWLDGINAGDARVRQFVAAPLGGGETVEEQLTGSADMGGVQLHIFEPKPGRFPDRAPPGSGVRFESAIEGDGLEMGIAAGGWIRQKIYPDPYGLSTWNPENSARVSIHIVNSEAYAAITGESPPPSPVSPKMYTDLGLPWFALYDESYADVSAPARLRGVQSLRELAAKRGDSAGREEHGLAVDPAQVVGLRRGENPR